METDFEEDITKLNRIGLIDRKAKLRRDKQFAQYKYKYWGDICKNISILENQLMSLELKFKGICDRCSSVPNIKYPLKTLPSGEKVCKTCWCQETDKKLKINLDLVLTGTSELDNECIDLYLKSKRERLMKV